MEYMELEGRVKHLECLLIRAKADDQLGMACYYRVMIEVLMELGNEKAGGFNCPSP
ncbi:hypothetical protein [Marinomonas transparens]|uniref:Uncharacterized protein n=1 Tax=Marinomonas transparens TaxID=2795388 RepID=A0A934N4A2_9GAMM|nr:hypothetical protein [Marinomonas transparens]MBJ7539858.1 hypothetical protein [Marinomonas transparens]